jgi:RNA polymerase sigma factor (sigma-70 family)
VNEKPDARLLSDFASRRDEAAFHELVTRHAGLVYSAALRQLESPAVAADVAQTVFTDLAQKAASLAGKISMDSSLAGWLHRATRYVALNHLRDDRRRRDHERQAMEQLLIDSEPSADWRQIAPVLDEALDSLDDDDREALLLRYFKNQDFRAVGVALGVSDDTAQKRVSRAVEKLREFFSNKKITIGAGSLGILISANAVQSAPAGLVATLSTTALAGAAGTTVAVIAGKTIIMTTMQKILVGATVAILAGAGIYEASQAAKLRGQNEAMRQQQTAAEARIQALQTERDADTNLLAALEARVAAAAKPDSTEVLKLRGEVGVLKTQNRMAGEKSALSKITSDPTTRNAIREQQKYGMKLIYGDFAKKLQLSPDQTEKFNSMMADSVMDNIDRITQILHDGTPPADADKIFASANTELEGKVQAMLGDDALAQFKDYSQNVLSTLGTAQFVDNLTGDADQKAQKKTALQQALQQAMTQVIQQNGLPANFQFVPSLNFANFTSEATLNQNLNLLDAVFQDVATTSSSFLTPEEQASFQTFRTNALTNNRMLIEMNQKLMAPLSQ